MCLSELGSWVSGPFKIQGLWPDGTGQLWGLDCDVGTFI